MLSEHKTLTQYNHDIFVTVNRIDK